MSSRLRSPSLLFGLRLLFALAALTALWLPEFLHSRVVVSPPDPATLAAARTTPSAAVLAEIGDMSLAVGLGLGDGETLAVAEEILAGRLRAPTYLDQPLKLAAYPQDFETGPPTLRLALASLAVEDRLVRAYEISKDRRFLDAALRRIESFAAHESSRWIDHGFLWNDHAVAARVAVLARLWRHVRERDDVGEASGRAILRLAAYCIELLSRPDHFTARTNHGVMQNIGLLQLAAAFPSLDPERRLAKLAMQRLEMQLGFYVSPEGFILEHSAGYHAHGSELLAMARRLAEMNGSAPPKALVEAGAHSHDILQLLRRPDGSLPAFGNTDFAGSSAEHTEIPAPPPGDHLFPVAGYALWWTAADESRRRAMTQTVVAWAKHDGHGHKHADEASLLLWSEGVSWITATGYWPYGHRLTRTAYSWGASNAPHARGEAANTARRVNLLGHLDAAQVRALDIERTNADGAVFRRQIVQIGGDLVAVLDFVSGSAADAETVWTFSPQAELGRDALSETFLLRRGESRMQVAFAPHGAVVTPTRGSESPFAGWVVRNGRPTAAPALLVARAAPASTTAAVFRLLGPAEDAMASPPSLGADASPERWSLRIPATTGTLSLERQGADFVLREEGPAAPAAKTLLWQAAPDVAAARTTLREAYARAVEAYPPWRDLSQYRFQASHGVAALWLLVEGLLFALRRLRPRLAGVPAHVAIALGWTGAMAYLLGVYLV